MKREDAGERQREREKKKSINAKLAPVFRYCSFRRQAVCACQTLFGFYAKNEQIDNKKKRT